MSYFDEEYYLNKKAELMNATAEDGRTDWDSSSVLGAITDAGLTPEEHYREFGYFEGLKPDPYFDEDYYLNMKARLMNENGEGGRDDWTAGEVREAILDAGMTPAEHYEKYGSHEKDADGNLINPSNAFDANAYVIAKLAQLQADPETAEEWADATAADVFDAICGSEMSVISHYKLYGAASAEEAGIPFVQTVPVVSRVPNDENRLDNVPSNYNSATPAPEDVDEGYGAAKPCDVGQSVSTELSPEPEYPEDPVPVPGGDDYIPVPGGGITDTNENPASVYWRICQGNELLLLFKGKRDVLDARCSQIG